MRITATIDNEEQVSLEGTLQETDNEFKSFRLTGIIIIDSDQIKARPEVKLTLDDKNFKDI